MSTCLINSSRRAKLAGLRATDAAADDGLLQRDRPAGSALGMMVPRRRHAERGDPSPHLRFARNHLKLAATGRWSASAAFFEVFAKPVLTLAQAIAYIRLTNDGGGAEAARKGSRENWFEPSGSVRFEFAPLQFEFSRVARLKQHSHRGAGDLLPPLRRSLLAACFLRTEDREEREARAAVGCLSGVSGRYLCRLGCPGSSTDA
ncbi:hypothetical protein, partial [Antarcticirhabdus aurantiaca]|uniref:hypothetical protein n=1 Tax=Antarcticirhabdus aurantiaca TaxID=2606717 RepID=UPI001AED2183